MKKIASLLCAASLAATLVAGQSIPIQASPLPLQAIPMLDAGPDVIQVQRSNREHRRAQRHHNPPRHGHRRHRNENVVPLIGGLAAGALVLGAIEAERARERERLRREREVYYDDDYHIEWCLDRYRSYDIRSDTYQPFEGPRRRCISPYS